MVKVIVAFLAGLACGTAIQHVRLMLLREKIKFYESYIHRRLEEAVPFVSEHLKPH